MSHCAGFVKSSKTKDPRLEIEDGGLLITSHNYHSVIWRVHLMLYCFKERVLEDGGIP